MPGGLRQELSRLAELVGLVGFAVVLPVLGPFGESPQTFVAAGSSPTDIVVFGLTVLLVPLVLLAAVGAAGRLAGERARAVVHLSLIGLLAGLAAVYVARDLGASGGAELSVPWRVAVGLAAGAVVALAAARWEVVRTYLRFTSPVPIYLLAAFLFWSPVAPLVRPAGAEAVVRVEGDHPSVVVIVLDELPTLSLVAEGEIDADLFPNLARMASTSTWYRDHTTVSPDTSMAVPAIVTGQYPPEDPVPAIHGEYGDTLFTLLAPTHRVHAVEWVTDLCPDTVCPENPTRPDAGARALAPSLVASPPSPLATLLDSAGTLWLGQTWPTVERPQADFSEPGASDPEGLVRPGMQFVSGLVDTGDGRPVLDYLHVPLPHQPWELLPSGQAYEGAHPPPGNEYLGWPDSATGVELAAATRSRHLLQLQWTDRLLGEVIDRLQALDRWDESIVVVTADHGVAFSRGNASRWLTPGNQAELAWSPLLVKAPGQQVGEVVDGNVLSIDVLPTVADLAGIEVPWDVDGVSMVGRDDRGDPAKLMRPSNARDYEPLDDDGFVELGVDGLAAVRLMPSWPGAHDQLRPWRFGRQAELLGRSADELGRCGEGAAADVELPEDFESFMADPAGSDLSRLPVWIEGTIDEVGQRDIVAVVDGVVAGWAPARQLWGRLDFHLLLALPVLEDHPGGELELYSVDPAGDGCLLRSLSW